MATTMYIFGESALLCWRSGRARELDLKYDLENFLQDRGKVLWNQNEDHGLQWNVDLLLQADPDDVDGWIQRLTTFLRQWGVQDRILLFTTVRAGTPPKWDHRCVEIAE